MKPDYKNWIPKGMLYSLIAGTLLSLVLLLILGVFGIGVSGKLRIALGVVFGIAFVVCAKYTEWCVHAYRSFSYDGERKLSKQIIEGTARYVTLPEGGIGLDVGCGSGALTIACAKRNPQGRMLGIDRWGKEYASFSLPLCEKNAAAEGVKNISFQRGNAVKLDFPDESFDAVTSNYVYHNITGEDKQALLLETLRVLKKGGLLLNFDANWYAYLFDEDAQAAYDKDRANSAEQGVWDQNVGADGEHFDVMEDIARRVPLSDIRRPAWDLEQLSGVGLQIEADEMIWQRVWSDEEKVSFASTPMFLVRGKRV